MSLASAWCGMVATIMAMFAIALAFDRITQEERQPVILLITFLKFHLRNNSAPADKQKT